MVANRWGETHYITIYTVFLKSFNRGARDANLVSFMLVQTSTNESHWTRYSGNGALEMTFMNELCVLRAIYHRCTSIEGCSRRQAEYSQQYSEYMKSYQNTIVLSNYAKINYGHLNLEEDEQLGVYGRNHG